MKWERQSNGIHKRVLSLFLCAATVCGMFSLDTVGVSAAEKDSGIKDSALFLTTESQTILYLDKGSITIGDGTVSGYDKDGKPVATPNPAGYLITQTDGGQATGNSVSVTGGKQEITIEDLNISSGGSPFALSGNADVTLTLSGSNTLKSGNNCAGLQVPDGTKITIDGTDADKLTAIGSGTRWNGSTSYGGAGIGGGNEMKNGSITINGGRIAAYGSVGGGAGVAFIVGGSGIGSGAHSDSGTITINGGTIVANSYGAAAIGSGYNYNGNSNSYTTVGPIKITGGTVTANGTGGTGAGIGGGERSNGGIVTISGGNVTATGGSYTGGGNGAPGIGGGSRSNGGNVTISGGTVTATGYGGGAGIGGALNDGSGHTDSGTVTITGGTITATGGGSGAGIGNGGAAGSSGTVTITGGSVKASSISSIPKSSQGSDGVPVYKTTYDKAHTLPMNVTFAYNQHSFTVPSAHPNDSNLYFYLPEGIQKITENGSPAIAKVTTDGNGFFGDDCSDKMEISGTSAPYGTTPSPTLAIDGKTIDNSKVAWTYAESESGPYYAWDKLPANLKSGAGKIKVGSYYIKADYSDQSVYQLGEKTAPFTVTPAAPIINGTLTATVPYESKLSSSIPIDHTHASATGIDSTTVSGAFVWENPGSEVKSSGTYDAKFVPDNSADYSEVSNIPVTVTLSPAAVSNTQPLVVSAPYGALLANTNAGDAVANTLTGPDGEPVSGTFSWTSDDPKTFDPAKTYYVNFTPDNPKLYQSLQHLTVTFQVQAAQPKITPPTARAVYGARLDQISFQGGKAVDNNNTSIVVSGHFEWENPDKVVKSSGTYDAEFVPDNSADYSKVSNIQVTVTMTPADVASVTCPQESAPYGTKLSGISLGSGTGTGVGGEPVSGTFQWKDPSQTVTQSGNYPALFVPDDPNCYSSKPVEISVTMKGLVPTVAEKPTASEIFFGDALSKSTLSGGTVTGLDGTKIDGTFEWADPARTVTASGVYAVVFHPYDTARYQNSAEITVYVFVQKRTAQAVQLPTASPVPLNSLLSASKLRGGTAKDEAGLPVSGTFVWANPGTRLTSAGVHTYPAVFVPDNPAEYGGFTTSISVTVQKITPQMETPPALPQLPRGTKLSAFTFSGGKMTDGNGNPVSGSFRWKTPDAAVEHSGDFEAVFTPDDTADYESAAVKIHVAIQKIPTHVTEIPSGTPVKDDYAVRGSVLSGGSAADNLGIPVPGTFAWTSPLSSVQTDPKTQGTSIKYSVTFTPSDPDFSPCTCMVSIAIEPIDHPYDPTYKSDTTYALNVYGDYTFKITSENGKEPVFTIDTPGIFQTKLIAQSGPDYYYSITAVGKPGSTACICVNGERLLIAIVRADAVQPGRPKTYRSDTTYPLDVYNDYIFKITSKNGKEPVFVVGTPGVFRTRLVMRHGSDYYFQIAAIGKPGSTAGIYINGEPRLLVAAVRKSTGK